MRMSRQRIDLITARGLLVVKVGVPPRPTGDTFHWLLPPLDIMPPDARWIIDGSLYDEARYIARRTGFGVAVVTTAGDLLACGFGIPPDWVHDVAGAEASAYFVVTREALTLPAVVTDCLGVLEGLRVGAASATDPRRRLARVWGMVAHSIDGRFVEAADSTTWMPAHGAVHTIGVAIDSRGRPVNPLLWRANRLVDLLAKHAAMPHRVPRKITNGLRDFAKLARHRLLQLGVVTLAANNHVVNVIGTAGVSQTRTMRDSEGCKPQKPARRAAGRAVDARHDSLDGRAFESRIVCDPPAQPRPCSEPPRGCRAAARPSAPLPQAAFAAKRRREQSLLGRNFEGVEDEARVARWMANLHLAPSAGDARSRMEALRQRVRAREREAARAQ